MAALRDYPPLRIYEIPARRPSRTRMIVAVLLLSLMGLLAAASGFASKSYQHAPAPAPGKYVPPAPHYGYGPNSPSC